MVTKLANKPSLFLIGPGYLGGSVLQVLLRSGKFTISCSCRNERQASILRDLGCTPVIAQLDDKDAVTEAAASHEVIINTASADHWESINATLEGIESRHAAGLRTVYLHTSGTGATLDDAQGLHGTDLILDDGSPEHLQASFNDGAIHRLIDKAIVEKAAAWRSSEGSSRSPQQTEVRVLLPPNIFGAGTGPFRKLGNVLPNVIRAGIDGGVPVRQGEGANTATCVHVEDYAEAYLVLLQALLEQGEPRPAFPEDLYVFGTSGAEYTWREICEQIGKKLYSRHLVKQEETVTTEREHLIKHDLVRPKELWNGSQDFCAIGGNDRSRASKLCKLGWSAPRSTKDALIASIDVDIDEIISTS